MIELDKAIAQMLENSTTELGNIQGELIKAIEKLDDAKKEGYLQLIYDMNNAMAKGDLNAFVDIQKRMNDLL